MNSYKVLGLICLLMAMAAASPLPFADNAAFADFLRNAQLTAPSKESVVVKRRIFEDNADGQLKQISLRSLIGDLENSILASALSVNKVFTDKDVIVPEIKVSDDSEHDINQGQSLANEETKSDLKTTTSTTTTTAESSVTLPVTDKVIIQTTEKVTQPSVVPTHIVIDRIAIQPHTGGIALIPIFELKRSTNDENGNKGHEITKITISKTEITSLATAAPESSTSSSTTNSTTSTVSTSKPAETVLETATTPKNIEQLKEAEEDLKEKVAEIEAEPIILSARV
ncbi:uncharacterized protein LOC135963091 [Calliphora vicina]|uniref:uncharacterized protein LOC135963091 n=1 Tax=Calliphora vicina TaxID=7373 RepID=UPI00325B2644